MSDIDKVLIVAINSRFIHSNTAVYYLHRKLSDADISSDVRTFSINDNKHDILEGIFSQRPGIVGFSCYIWNISLIYELCRDIKHIDNDTKIILGGPEVTYEPSEALEKSGADMIVRGEGENVIVSAVLKLQNGVPGDCPGLYYRHNEKITDTGIAITGDLSKIPSPFTDFMMQKEIGKMIYYEASRGCPFNCIYCLSSATTGVRYFPLERVFQDLDSILNYNPKIIKFTDRSFNTNEKRTLAILEYIKNLETKVCFHLEIFPAGLTDMVMDALITMPEGRVQLEAGIQSVNQKTLEASGRIQDPVRALANMKKMILAGNMHIHLDLIAGLPHENLESFTESFNKTIAVAPHMLQLGFLKMLKGTDAREADGYICEQSPPYEVLATPWISFAELCELKGIEKCIDLFYNTGRFRSYLLYMHKKYNSVYDFYKELTEYLLDSGINLFGISRDGKYKALAMFSSYDKVAISHLCHDFMMSYSSKNIPEYLGKCSLSKEEVFSFLKNDENIPQYFSKISDSSPKKLFKMCNIGCFDFGNGPEYFLFKYLEKNSVTGLFEKNSIQI